jgi:glycosyltransferase involved in cell wall biosynthesis
MRDRKAHRVVLLDEEYQTYSGHHGSYDLPICEELRRRGIPYLLLTDSGFDAPAGLINVLPTFHTRMALHISLRLLPRFLNRVLGAALGTIVTTLDLIRLVTRHVSSGDVIVLCRPLARTRLAYGLWLLYLSVRSRLINVVYVVHNEPEPLFDLQIGILRRFARCHRLEFVAHSPAIARVVSERLGGAPTVLPLPFKPLGPLRPPITQIPVRFAFLGLGHWTKGLDLVVEAVEKCLPLHSGEITFAIQLYLPFTDPVSEDLHRRTRLLATNFDGVEILGRELTAPEYTRQLELAHVILVPHRLEAYRFALSGVFADAMSAGRPVIVAKGSYMSELIQDTGAGVTFESGSAASLCDALSEAGARLPDVMARAQLVAERWKHEQGPAAFVSYLSALAVGPF